jgi:hypothetical protein
MRPEVVAHEVGHMLGAYDEYPGGSLDPERPVQSPGSLMSASPGPEVRCAARHLDAVRRWARMRFGEARLVALDAEARHGLRAPGNQHER